MIRFLLIIAIIYLINKNKNIESFDCKNKYICKKKDINKVTPTPGDFQVFDEELDDFTNDARVECTSDATPKLDDNILNDCEYIDDKDTCEATPGCLVINYCGDASDELKQTCRNNFNINENITEDYYIKTENKCENNDCEGDGLFDPGDTCCRSACEFRDYYHNKLYETKLQNNRNYNLKTLRKQSGEGAASSPQPIISLPSLPDKFIKKFKCLNDDDCSCIKDGVCIDNLCVSVHDGPEVEGLITLLLMLIFGLLGFYYTNMGFQVIAIFLLIFFVAPLIADIVSYLPQIVALIIFIRIMYSYFYESSSTSLIKKVIPKSKNK